MNTITISNQTYTIKQITPIVINILAVAYQMTQGVASDTTDRLLALALMSGILAGDIETNGQTVADDILASIRAAVGI